MSKLYDKYLFLKSTEDNSNKNLYLFKSGIFFIFLDQDAKIASSLLNLKLTFLTPEIVKCGFPINSLEKYKLLLTNSTYSLKIIDNTNDTIFNINEYSIDNKISELLYQIRNIDTNSLSIKEAYEFIDNIKNTANSIQN